MRPAGLACAAMLALAVPGPAFAQAYQCTLPRHIKPPAAPLRDGPVRRVAVASYILSASWSPEYCHFNSGREEIQCSGRFGKFGFVLHGLWPQAARGPAPQWCPSRAPLLPRTIRRHLCMIPSPTLMAHEWAKHGACMVGRPETYFKMSAILWQSIVWPDADRLSRQKDLTAGALREAFNLANPAWQASQIGVEISRTGWLKGLRLCYGKDFRPRACSRRDLGAANSAPLKIWHGL